MSMYHGGVYPTQKRNTLGIRRGPGKTALVQDLKLVTLRSGPREGLGWPHNVTVSTQITYFDADRGSTPVNKRLGGVPKVGVAREKVYLDVAGGPFHSNESQFCALRCRVIESSCETHGPDCTREVGPSHAGSVKNTASLVLGDMAGITGLAMVCSGLNEFEPVDGRKTTGDPGPLE